MYGGPRMSPNLTFDEAAHKYTLAGRVIPSVTQIIGNVFPRQYSPGDYYLQRGSALHKAIQFLAMGRLDFNSVDASYRPKLEAYEKAVAELDINILYSEKRLASHTLLFAGTIDAYATCCNIPTLIDYKSSIEPTVLLQLSAYWYLLKECGWELPAKALALELKDDGNYKCHWYTKREMQLGWQTFLAALTVHNFMQKHNLTPTTKESVQ